MRLLLVEDDVMVASGIKLGLSDAGYAVDWVGSGERAEEVLRGEVFDAAIIDIGLPNMDGLELTRRLRRPEMASRWSPAVIFIPPSFARTRLNRFGSFYRTARTTSATSSATGSWRTNKCSPHSNTPTRPLTNRISPDLVTS